MGAISATGRIPSSAAPTAAPTRAAAPAGVATTRNDPNISPRPPVTPDPPAWAPIANTRSSRSISSRSPEWSASSTVMSSPDGEVAASGAERRAKRSVPSCDTDGSD